MLSPCWWLLSPAARSLRFSVRIYLLNLFFKTRLIRFHGSESGFGGIASGKTEIQRGSAKIKTLSRAQRVGVKFTGG